MWFKILVFLFDWLKHRLKYVNFVFQSLAIIDALLYFATSGLIFKS